MNDAAVPCPEPLRLAFHELLEWTLISIRSHSSDPELVFALADHAHNIPSLLSDFTPDRLQYYWEVERDCFLRAVPPDKGVAGMLQPHWTVIKQEYWRICFPLENADGDL